MPFPANKPYNPSISKTVILGPSSGNPKSFQDPNSVATIGSTIQAMADQAKADTLYDPPPPISEGFTLRNEIYNPWILKTEVCKKEGFKYNPSTFNPPNNNLIIAILGFLGFLSIYMSFARR
jgi:hypothetical protein